MIGKKFANFEVLSKIGEGGMGSVFRAHDSKLGREVALKVLSDDVAGNYEYRTRFEREVKAIAAHDDSVNTLDWSSDGNLLASGGDDDVTPVVQNNQPEERPTAAAMVEQLHGEAAGEAERLARRRDIYECTWIRIVAEVQFARSKVSKRALSVGDIQCHRWQIVGLFI